MDHLSKIQICLSGGGARLASLMAAAKAIGELSHDVVEVRACSGTSAGAMAAVLLASGADIEALRDYLKSREGELKRVFPRNPILIFWRFVKATITLTSIYNEKLFREIIADCLNHVGISPETPLHLLPTKVRIYIVASEFETSKPIYFSNVKEPGFEHNRSVIDCLVESASLPGILSSIRSLGPDDGALIDNIPIDPLRKNIAKFGPIVVATFPPDKPQRPRWIWDLPRYFFDLLKTQSRSNYFKVLSELGRDSILDMPVSIKSNEFHRFAREGLGENFDRCYDYTMAKIYAWNHSQRRSPEARTYDRTSNLDARNTPLDLNFQSKHLNRPVEDGKRTHTLCKLSVYAHSLRSDLNSSDEIYYETHVRSRDGELLWGMPLSLMNVTSGDVGPIEVDVYDNLGKSIDFRLLPMPGEVDRKDRRQVYVSFSRPLGEGDGDEAFIIVKKETVSKFLTPLLETGEDFISLSAVSEGFIERAVIELFVPSDFPPFTSEDGGDRDGGEEIASSAIEPIPRSEVPSWAIGHRRTVRNLRRGTRMRIIYKLNRG